ncbi:putative transposase [Streptomyces griseus subsp. griseus NBRC 13350]|uniref:Transposase n=1 Tax=Streptomyces griseus subsp. griseus (strain JCM 4626 / CBS 651.72 / NBRC 13350 / KCC S-0626 / ISP 5235) TaxID=455632 RepID=B1VPN5_STRGG|nr:hypothetical protein ACZ90_16790 [Streptomyces albus subsp. albus]BAG23785.1 putative transposase [Streptomyces griseus subsp. griseus NBRC 13350]
MGSRPWIADDELWALIEPLPPPWPERLPGPRPVSDRWQKAGGFDRLHQVLLADLNADGELDWSRTCVGGSRIRAKEQS